VYEKILVSLDGTKQSECVLDQVRMLAKGCNIPKIVLLRVVEPFPAAAVNYLGDQTARDVQKKSVQAANEYLSYVGDAVRTSCGGLETVVLEGNPAHEIIEYAKHHGVDLIAMSTHSESGMMRLSMGSVTRHVVDTWGGPTLVIPPSACLP
jgi:nucleotide-binding universal stress UspA family protein